MPLFIWPARQRGGRESCQEIRRIKKSAPVTPSFPTRLCVVAFWILLQRALFPPIYFHFGKRGGKGPSFVGDFLFPPESDPETQRNEEKREREEGGIREKGGPSGTMPKTSAVAESTTVPLEVVYLYTSYGTNTHTHTGRQFRFAFREKEESSW